MPSVGGLGTALAELGTTLAFLGILAHELGTLTKWLNKSLHLASLPTVPEVIRQIGKTRLGDHHEGDPHVLRVLHFLTARVIASAAQEATTWLAWVIGAGGSVEEAVG